MRTTLFITLAYMAYVGQMYVENQFGIKLLEVPVVLMLLIMALAFAGDLKDLFTQ